VEAFLGAERSLKRLTLAHVSDLELSGGAIVTDDATPSEACIVMDREGTNWVGVVRDDHFLGWVPRTALDGQATMGEIVPEPPAAWVRPGSTLREALEVIMTSQSSAAVVSDGERFTGIVTLEKIREGLEA
ncbi:MAG: CBS domain-containing protein, partial [Acidimicrobiales bacterium]